MPVGDILGYIKNGAGNILINGAYEFDQDKEGGAYTVNGTYCLDQWILGDTLSCLRATVTTNPYGFVLRSNATAQQNRFIQRIEQKRIKHLIVGSKITFSVYAEVKTGSWSANPMRVRIDSANAVDDFSGVTTQSFEDMIAISGLNIPDGTRRRFYKSITVTQSMVDNGFQLVFGDFTNATNQVEYSMTMLSIGGLSPFERSGVEYSLELALCRRYYEKSWSMGTPIGTADAISDFRFQGLEVSVVNDKRLNIPFLVEKRSVPLVTPWSLNGLTNATRFSTISGQTHTNDIYIETTTTRSARIVDPTSSTTAGIGVNWVANARL